jgi:signal transduction histidine kinase
VLFSLWKATNKEKERMDKTSIRKKLTTFGMMLLFGSTAVFIIGGFLMSFLSSTRSFSRAKTQIENDLLTKGMILISNNSVALRGIVEDNAYSALREIVVTTVKQDSDMVYGIFMDENKRPLVMASSQNPDSTFEYPHVLNDSVSGWAQTLKQPGQRKIDKKNAASIIEFSAPIMDGSGKSLGTIRYGISMSRMMENVNKERKHSEVEFIVFLSIYFFLAALILFIGLRFAIRQATKITVPIELLTKAAYEIAHGDYDREVVATTSDEIGSLAENFEQMRKTIKQYTGNLEKMVADRTRELKEAQKELVEKAHQSGMADIAAGTLHNVGNLLNSLKASVEATETILNGSPLDGLTKANKLLGENMSRIDEFMTADPRGKKLLQYYLKIEEPLQNAFDQVVQNIKRVIEKVAVIGDVIAAQQSYAGVGGLSEKVKLSEIIEDALTMQSGTIDRHNINLVREYSDVPEIFVQKTKLVHIMVNLIKNAKDAMEGLTPDKKTLVLSVTQDNRAIFICVKDSGCGIPADNITKIFSHGFTTKKAGHGFGLHSCANYMKEMGGEIWAESGGLGKGASFTLKFTTAA